MKKLLLAVVGIGLCATLAHAQLNAGSWGISPGITFGPLGTTRPVEVVYAIASNWRLDGDLIFSTFSNTTSYTTLGIAVGSDYYLWQMESIATFVGGNIGLGSTSGPGGSSSFVLNGEFGADYFLTPRFSINGSMGLGLAAGGNTTTLTTQTSLHATWWFK